MFTLLRSFMLISGLVACLARIIQLYEGLNVDETEQCWLGVVDHRKSLYGASGIREWYMDDFSPSMFCCDFFKRTPRVLLASKKLILIESFLVTLKMRKSQNSLSLVCYKIYLVWFYVN